MLMACWYACVLAMAEVEPGDLHQLCRDLEERVERRHRVLKDHRDAFAAYLADVFDRQSAYVDTVKDDLAVDDLTRRFRDKPHHRQVCNRFAAARFTDDAESLAFVQFERDPVDCLYHAVLGMKIGLEALDREDCSVRVGHQVGVLELTRLRIKSVAESIAQKV